MYENFKELYEKEKMRAEALEMDVFAMSKLIRELQGEVNSYKNIMGHTDLNAVQPTKGGTS
jgi:hypothetical protein